MNTLAIEGWRIRSVVRVTVVSQHRHLVSHARDVYQSALSPSQPYEVY